MPGKTRAKASVFGESEAYEAKGVVLYEAVMALDAVAANGQEALAPAQGRLGGTCKGCHEDHSSKDF